MLPCKTKTASGSILRRPSLSVSEKVLTLFSRTPIIDGKTGHSPEIALVSGKHSKSVNECHRRNPQILRSDFDPLRAKLLITQLTIRVKRHVWQLVQQLHRPHQERIAPNHCGAGERPGQIAQTPLQRPER